MVYGIQALESVLLTEVGRTLEEDIDLHKTQWRLSRIRSIKTCYDLENVRVLNYQSLPNLMPLVQAVTLFAACVLDHDQRLRIMAGYVERAAKRLFGIPDFKYYALADGLCALFSRHPGRPGGRPSTSKAQQLDLWVAQPT